MNRVVRLGVLIVSTFVLLGAVAYSMQRHRPPANLAGPPVQPPGGVAGTKAPSLPPPALTSAIVLATNDLGMHCVDADFSVFSILPPYNVVKAQVIAKDVQGVPHLLNNKQVYLQYSAVAHAANSINSSSVSKSNFWQYVLHTYGAPLAPGQGIKGLYMPKDARFTIQTTFPWSTSLGLFLAEGIPIFPIDDAGQHNYYPLLRLTAYDRVTDRSLGHSDVVLPVSDETTCRTCHATGKRAANGGGIAWSTNPDVEVQSRTNVLLLHDSRNGTHLYASHPVLCAGCHYSPALDLAHTGPSNEQKLHDTMSRAMHSYHATRLLNDDGTP